MNNIQQSAALRDFVETRRRTFYAKTDLESGREELEERLKQKARLLTPELQEEIILLLKERVSPRIDTLESVQGGTFHLLLRARLPGEPFGYFVRVETAHPNRPAFEFLIEEEVARIVRSPNRPASEILFTDLTRSRLPWDFQVVREAPGVALSRVENPETQLIPEAILENLGRTLARIHQIKAKGAGLLNPAATRAEGRHVEGVLPAWEDYIFLNLSRHVALCQSSLAISPAEASLILKTFEEARPIFAGAPSALLHGDPGHHNIFVQGEEISAIIDWEDALAGDPVFDLAYWGTFVRDYLRDPCLRGYAEVSGLPGDFERRYWLYYLRVALSKTVHRLLFGATDRPGRPPASQRIQKALAHLA